MRKLVVDIETDGIKATKIHCIVAYDIDTKETYIYRSDYGNLQEFTTLLNDAPCELIMHNGIGYDVPILERIQGISFRDHTITDTMVLSRLANPSRAGGHGLRNLADGTANEKSHHDDWSVVSDDMVEYCVRDVVATADVYERLLEELAGFSVESVALEHEVQWIISRQVQRGWLLDQRKATELLGKLKEAMISAEAEVHKRFLPKVSYVHLEPIVTKSGAVGKMAKVANEDRKVRLTDEEHEEMLKDSKVTRTIVEPFNLGSRKQIGDYLQDFGWKPEKFTETGQPIVDEKVLGEVKDIPEASLIAEYLLLQKRIAQVKSWLDAVDEDDQRVHGRVNTNGAVTGRMTHQSPNMAQVPAVYSPYGADCRGCWIVPEGFKLVGCDASGLELRMLAHYMNDPEYTKEILHGDIHTANQRAAGLSTRDQAKTFIYAFLYGAGDAKIGTIVGGSANDGRQLKEKFLRNTPALGKLRDDVGKAAQRGYLFSLDGRKVYVRSEHASLNTLLQSAGAIVMKKALTRLDHYGKLYGLTYEFIGNIHDEVQCEVREDQADFFGSLAVGAIQEAGRLLNLRCPLDGDYKVGNSWAETH